MNLKKYIEELKKRHVFKAGLAYFNLGMNTEALDGFNRVIEGNIQEGLSHAAKYEQFDFSDAEAWYFISFLNGMLGGAEACVRCLTRAIKGGFFNYPLMSRDPNPDPVRMDPEFQNVLQKARQRHLEFKKRYF